MSGIKDLEQLLALIQLKLNDEAFVFCTVSGQLNKYYHLNPIEVMAR